ncbi:hypothetical protein BJY59DRAFT_699223, partial [Rhodotorula toruloides]
MSGHGEDAREYGGSLAACLTSCKQDGLASDNAEERTVAGMIGALDETIAAFEQLQTSVRELRAELTDLRAEKERAKFVYAAKLCLKALILDLMLKYAEKSDPETASDLYDRLHVLCLTNWRGLHDKLLSSYNRRYLEGIVPPSFFDATRHSTPHDPFTASLRITTGEDLKAKNTSRNEDANSTTTAIFSEICRDVAQVDSTRIASLIELLPE